MNAADVPIPGTQPAHSGPAHGGPADNPTADHGGARTRLPTPADPTQLTEIAMWIAAVSASTGLIALLRASGDGGEPLSENFPPVPALTTGQGPTLSPASLAAVGVAVVVIIASWRNVHSRMRWGLLLAAGYLASFGWTLALAAAGARSGLPVTSEVLQGHLADLGTVGADPLAFWQSFTLHAEGFSQQTRTHPPGAALLLWALTKIGIASPTTLGLVITAASAATVPAVAIAVRSLCHETAARRLVPVLALAPWAMWMWASTDGMASAAAAAFVALGVVGSEPRRRLWWAAASGTLLGLVTLLNYGVAWLGIAVVATNFVRRRPVLNIITGGCFLIPLTLAALTGFSWPEGLAVARGGLDQADAEGPLPVTDALTAIAVVLAGCGPLIVRAARRIRLTPGWPFLVGAVPVLVFAILTGPGATGIEQFWLPAYCWLIVPALAPNPRPEDPGDTTRAGVLPLGIVGVGALSAIVLSAWGQ